MAHVRQQIREAFAAAVTGLTTTGARVYASRIYEIPAASLPALRITTDEESIAWVSVHPTATLERDISITCEAVAQAVADLDDTLDTIIGEVEVAIAADTTLGGLCGACRLESIAIDLSADGEAPTGRAAMRFTCRTYTLSNAPSAAIT